MKTLEYLEQDYSSNGLSEAQNYIINKSYQLALTELNDGGTIEFLEFLISKGCEEEYYENCAGIQRAIKQYYENETE